MAGAKHSQAMFFQARAGEKIRNKVLQKALLKAKPLFVGKRAKAMAALPEDGFEFEALRSACVDIRNRVLGDLDVWLELFEEKARATGAEVLWARDGDEICDLVIDVARRHGVTKATKSKSMLSEEAHLNEALAAAGIRPVETDLGEYIIQLRGEHPSHIIAPAVHLTKEQVAEDFRRVHDHLDANRDLSEAVTMLGEARAVLREKFLIADVGITGANFLVAETGTSIIVTNEGNGDLTQTLPKAHVVVASIEKVVPTLEDVATLMRVLARSATGQEMSVYTTFSTGPRRDGDPDGPGEYHVVLLDNGRSAMLGSEFEEMLRCIRCGACLNHCPVYHAIGGHAYGWVYPGPMGSVLTPTLVGIEKTGHLPNASTFCGRCESVCPMRIPLPKMMRAWRAREYERALNPATQRFGLGVWAFLARRPGLYRLAARIGVAALRLLAGSRGRIARLPLGDGWTKHRDMPAPEGGTFMDRWKKGERR